MDFEEMKVGCPWLISGWDHDDPNLTEPDFCRALSDSHDLCSEMDCAPFHWIEELKNDLYISVSAELRSNSK